VVLPRGLALLNRLGLNRLTRLLFPWLPGFGVIEHAGRRSGRTFRTPVNVFPTADGYVFALTYGSRTDWVRNIQAAGSATLRTRGRTIVLTDPQLYVDRRYVGIRPPERWVLPLLGADEFLRMTARR